MITENSIWHQRQRAIEHREHHTEICSHCQEWMLDTTDKIEKCPVLVMIDYKETRLIHRMGVN